jgi:hypothetical protein
MSVNIIIRSKVIEKNNIVQFDENMGAIYPTFN